MVANKEDKTIRQAKVLELKLQGKSQKKIAKEIGTSQPTVSRDWTSLNNDESITSEINKLKFGCLLNASDAIEVESKFIKQIKEKETLHPREVEVVKDIKTTSQKIFTSLHGDMTNDQGGEITVVNYKAE